MTVLRPKVAVIGCGNVGVRYAYALAITGAAREIVLVDADRRRTEGEVMDLCHGAPFIPPVEIREGDYPEIAGSDIVALTAGRRQRPGESRLDLAKGNVGLFSGIVPLVMRHAPDAILLVVSNPVDVLSYAAWKFSGRPAGKVIGSGTLLDSARLRFLMARHCRVDARNIHAYVLGEHGESEFAAWSCATIGGVRIADYCTGCRNGPSCGRVEELDGLFAGVRDSAGEIIARKGETSYGIGLAMVRITRAILQDENAILPVSSLARDIPGVGEVYLSRPAVVNAGGVRDVLRIRLADGEEAALKSSAATIRRAIEDSGL